MNISTSQDLSSLLPATGDPPASARLVRRHGAIGTALRAVKRGLAAATKRSIVSLPLPLGLQHWAARNLLLMDPWDKSLTFHQCLANRVIARHGLAVQTGPFRGMTCLPDADEGCLIPKLLGCYEEELSPTLEGFIAAGYDRVIDVGCASGYYAIGLALRLPRAQVFGFDIDEPAIARCAKLAARNKVESRVTLLGRCTWAELQRLIQGRTLLIMDCDGPEFELLDPDAAPALRRCDIIVECHDFVNPAISATLQERFRQSHTIEKIPTRDPLPDATRLPGLGALPQKHWPEAVAEHRVHRQDWLVMRVR